MSDQAEVIARALPARATLMVGAVETEYLRCGAGEPVLVLDPALAAAVRAGRVPARWQANRLFVPERTTIDALAMRVTDEARGAVRAPFERWLRGMIDGLGLSATTVVVSRSLEDEVRRFAAAHPGEIVRVEAGAGEVQPES